VIRLVEIAVGRPRLTLIATAALTLVFAAGGLRLEIRTDGKALEPQGDPVVEMSARDRARFRDPRAVLLVVNARAQTPVASPQGFRFLRDLHADLRRLDVLRPAGILSLAGLPRIVSGGGGLSVGTHLDAIPDDPDGFAALLGEVRARALCDGLLLSRDGRRALFSLPLSEDVSVAEAIRALEPFAASAATPEFELLLGGPLIAETTLGEKVLRDLAVLVPLMLVAIVVLLGAMLRSPAGILIPMIETLLVLIWTFGAMGWAGAPIALVTTILPVVLMAMCITDEIHLLERLVAHWGEAGMRARVLAALRDVGRPIVATSLTTALGFLSFTSTSIAPLREFGLFAAFGILVAMLLSFSFIPALIVLLPERAFASGREGRGARGLAAYGRFAARRPGVCFALAAGALAVALPGLAGLRVSDSWVENFDPDSDVVRAERAINESFWGSYRFDVVFEAEAGSFHDPPGAALMERFRALAAEAPHVGGTETYLTPLEEIAAGLGVAGPLSALAPIELWDLLTLAEMSETRAGLTPLLGERGKTARARLYVRSPDYARARELTRYLDQTLPTIAALPDVAFHYSGDLPEASALVESIVTNQLRSIGWALATVGLVLLLLARRLAALWALVPVLAATLGLLGLMGLTGTELGIATSMFASLTVGVGVDFGIHFVHRFGRERALGKGAGAATQATIEKAGKALFWNAATLAAGFLVLTASSLKPNHSLGLLLAAATLACYAGSFLLLPLLLRRSSVRAVAVAAGAALLLTPALSEASEPVCDGSEDPDATRLMQRVERHSRTSSHILRMHVATHYHRGSQLATALGEDPEPKTLWGVVRGDPGESRQLFVFSGPGRMAGTSLLLRDFAVADKPDAMWFYLRAFGNFRQLGTDAEKTVVPGTALTYGDARGFIASDKYRFRNATGDSKAPVQVLGCPRTSEIADALGYGSILVSVDLARLLVRRVDYRGPGGRPLKQYVVVEERRLGEHVLPARIRLEHRANGFTNDIRYEHWKPKTGPDAALFRPDLAEGTFLDRLRRFLDENGLGDRIEAEIAVADARVRTWEERWAPKPE
jgi:predicted RND superfamily exporter protein